MILLIRMKAAAIRAVKTTLNSIMFLLIHDEDEEERKEFEQL